MSNTRPHLLVEASLSVADDVLVPITGNVVFVVTFVGMTFFGTAPDYVYAAVNGVQFATLAGSALGVGPVSLQVRCELALEEGDTAGFGSTAAAASSFVFAGHYWQPDPPYSGGL